MQFTRFVAAGFAAACSVALVASLGGCASAAGAGTVSLATAKAKTLSIETEMLGFIPKSSIVAVNQPKRSTLLFPCLHKQSESYWPSTMTVSLKPGLKSSDVLDAIGANWTNKSGWTASNSTAPDGTPTMVVVSDSGYSFTAEIAQGPVFTITALSECFPSAGLAGRSSY